MLVVDVPEGKLTQDARDVGNLKEGDCVPAVSQGASHHAHELLSRLDMFEGVPATHEVGGQVRILLGIEIGDEGDPGSGLAGEPAVDVARIDSDAPIVSQFAEERQELALTATDLQDVLAPETVSLDQATGEVLGKRLEAR